MNPNNEQKRKPDYARQTEEKPSKSGGPHDDKVPPPDPFVTHTPIIITGDSAAVEFERKLYPETGGVHQSSGLTLKSISITPTGAAGEVCHTLAAGEVCLVVIECKQPGQGDSNINILGGTAQSPKITFDHNEYGEVNLPSAPHRRKHYNGARKIEGLKIYKVVGGVPASTPFHICQRVPQNGKCKIVVLDEHVHPHE